jgi:hypothetical protein
MNLTLPWSQNPRLILFLHLSGNCQLSRESKHYHKFNNHTTGNKEGTVPEVRLATNVVPTINTLTIKQFYCRCFLGQFALLQELHDT